MEVQAKPAWRQGTAGTQAAPPQATRFGGKQGDFWKHPFRPYPHVLVGELLHLLLVQAGEEELVLQLLRVLQGQQGGVGAGLDDALPDAQVHGGGLGHPRGGARVHSSCGDTKRGENQHGEGSPVPRTPGKAMAASGWGEDTPARRRALRGMRPAAEEGLPHPICCL